MSENIDHIFYINLDKRVDRKELFEADRSSIKNYKSARTQKT